MKDGPATEVCRRGGHSPTIKDFVNVSTRRVNMFLAELDHVVILAAERLHNRRGIGHEG